MKILWLSHLVPYPPKGGVLQRSYNLIKEVCKYHDVTLLAFTQHDLLKGMFKSVQDGLEEAERHLNGFCEQVKFVPIPCENNNYGKMALAFKSILTIDPYSINWLKSSQMRAVISKSIGHQQYDVVHFDTISLAPYISYFPNHPKVLDHHNIESHMMLRRALNDNNKLKQLYFLMEGKKLLRYEKNMHKKFDMHITCSTLDTERLLDLDRTLHVEEIPNGVDIDYFYPMPENELKKHLVFAGGLSWYPNLDAMHFFADEIWPLLKKQTPDVVMNVIGKNPSHKLKLLAKQDSDFRVHGFVDDVRNYISKASIYICPIRDGGGTKLKLLDAFAMGMPTIAHPNACEGLEISHGENILLASTPSEFVNGIINLINDKGLRDKLGFNARNLSVEKYSFTEIGKNLAALYSKL